MRVGDCVRRTVIAEFAVQLLDVIGPSHGTRLLDVGSGRGAIAAAAAARGYAVTAVDAAPRMMSRLAAAHPEIDVRLMDIHHSTYPTTPTTWPPAASSYTSSQIPCRCSPSYAEFYDLQPPSL